MGWGLTRKQEEDKVEFEIPEDVKAKIEAGEKASQELTELRSSFETKNQELDSLKSEFASLKEAFANSTKVQKTDQNVDEQPDFYTDPDKAVSSAINKTLVPVVSVVAEMKADRIIEDLNRKYQELQVPAVQTEFTKAIEKYSLAERANKALMDNTFRIVRDRLRESGKLGGQEYDDVMERSRQNSSFNGQGSSDSSTKSTRKFSVEEKQFLDRYGISEEEAVELGRKH